MTSQRTLSECLIDYMEARSARYSPSTWEAHERVLCKMRDWLIRPSELGPACLLRDVDERTMVRYFNGLRPPRLSGSSFSNYRQYCMMFFKFCLAEGWIDRNPMRHVDPAPVVKRPRLQLSAQELLAALDGANPRDRIALALGMNTALRANDIMALKVGDVNLSNNELSAYIKKTKKHDIIAICLELREELIRWFDHYAQTMGLGDWMRDLPNGWTLVPPMHFQAANVWRPELGGRIVYQPEATYTHPERIVQAALERLGHPTKGEGFHTLRRSTARRFYELAIEKGVRDPMRMPQALLGHTRRETTEIYLGMTIEREMRDELLRGKSFLRAVADGEIRDRSGGEDGPAGAVVRSA